MPSRRSVLAGLSAVATPAFAATPPAPLVTVLGDSLTSGWGLTPKAALPVQLAAALSRLGVRARIRGSGVPGDTSAGGLARVAAAVSTDTRLCVVMLGANDFLLAIDPKETEANLDAIVRRLKARRIRVVLAGGQAPSIGRGRRYEAAFNGLFPKVARRHGTSFAPNVLAGVAGNRALLQADRLHPNAEGIRLIASRLAPVVAQALRA